MKQRHLLYLLAVLSVLGAGVGVVALLPRCPINEANFAKIKVVGMSQAEVESLLGGPPGAYTSRPYMFGRSRIVPTGTAATKEWLGDGGLIFVDFDKDAKVFNAHFQEVTFLREDFFRRVRRYLRL